MKKVIINIHISIIFNLMIKEKRLLLLGRIWIRLISRVVLVNQWLDPGFLSVGSGFGSLLPGSIIFETENDFIRAIIILKTYNLFILFEFQNFLNYLRIILILYIHDILQCA